MPKQFTFKTTRETAWIEPILDNMESGDRSKFIRQCLVDKLIVNRSGPKVTTMNVTPLSVQSVTKVSPPSSTPDDILDKLGLLYED